MVSELIKKTSYKVAEKSANQVCPFIFHQPKLPEAVKKLRK